MKSTLFILLTLLSVACNSTKFKVGDCIQKPDSIIIYKVDSIAQDGYLLKNITDSQSDFVKSKFSEQWIISTCNKSLQL